MSEYDLSSVVDLINQNEKFAPMGEISFITNLEYDTAKVLVELIKTTGEVPREFNGATIKTLSYTPAPTITCTYCGSTNVRRNHSVPGVMVGDMILGDFSGKSWYCRNCGSDF